MSTPSARTGGSSTPGLKFHNVEALSVRKWLRVNNVSGDGLLGHRRSRYVGKAGFPPAAVFVATCLVAGLGLS